MKSSLEVRDGRGDLYAHDAAKRTSPILASPPALAPVRHIYNPSQDEIATRCGFPPVPMLPAGVPSPSRERHDDSFGHRVDGA